MVSDVAECEIRDWLFTWTFFLSNAIKSRLLIDRDLKLNLLTWLVFSVNKEKSQLVLLQQIVNMDGMFQLNKELLLPTPDRVKKKKSAVLKINNSQVTTRDYLQLLGLMTSCIEMKPYAPLHMRPIQLHLLFWLRPAYRNMAMIILCSSHLKQHLSW